jgi:hypothetical protein
MNALLLVGALLCPTAVPKLVALPEGCPAPLSGVLYTPEYHKGVVDAFKGNKAELDLLRTKVPELRLVLQEAKGALVAARNDLDALSAENKRLDQVARSLGTRPDNRWSWAAIGAGGAVLGALVPLFTNTQEPQALGLVVLGGAVGVLVGWLAD